MKTTLISATELAAWPPGDVLVIDCRQDLSDPGKGERDYRAGHLPGALYASLDRDLSDLSRQSLGLGRHPLPLESDFAAVLGRWGWRPGLQVVAYDAAGGALAAARLWWMMRSIGAPAVAVLDGGLAAWLAAGLPLETGVPDRASTQVDVHYDPAMFVLDHAALAQRLVIDARAAPRYRGDTEPLDRVGGHIPGALNRPFADNLAADGRFRPADELRRDFLGLLGEREPGVVLHSCGSGVTAGHNLLAMEHAGLTGSGLYAPSWSGWVSDPARPIATGEA
ncbi:sulfurtransferase [Dyella sp. A6]|uniref:sulfurtransferase n=1 Tax=Dyella aluminiiresistens TaxID=3069105 RepID=UPI002E7611B8|nr:sulfurtransferase [Dyella sp. A6]